MGFEDSRDSKVSNEEIHLKKECSFLCEGWWWKVGWIVKVIVVVVVVVVSDAAAATGARSTSCSK